jgi:acyl carrier protein
MSPDVIRQVLSEIVHEQLEWKGQLPENELASAFDSMQRLTLVVAIEDRFRICLDDDDEKEIRTIDDLIAMIRKKLDA